MDEILQLKITLKDTKPPIWRRVLVDRNSTFAQLHYIIQIAMGWNNSHLYEFSIERKRIGIPNEELDDFDLGGGKLLDAGTEKIENIINSKKIKFGYEYDFGDGWSHLIEVEKFLPKDDKISYPICLDGKLNCPPEDCGGVHGFYDLLEILGDEENPDREDALEWIGGNYNPDQFDMKMVNADLKSLDQFMKDDQEEEEEL